MQPGTCTVLCECESSRWNLWKTHDSVSNASDSSPIDGADKSSSDFSEPRRNTINHIPSTRTDTFTSDATLLDESYDSSSQAQRLHILSIGSSSDSNGKALIPRTQGPVGHEQGATIGNILHTQDPRRSPQLDRRAYPESLPDLRFPLSSSNHLFSLQAPSSSASSLKSPSTVTMLVDAPRR